MLAETLGFFGYYNPIWYGTLCICYIIITNAYFTIFRVAKYSCTPKTVDILIKSLCDRYIIFCLFSPFQSHPPFEKRRAWLNPKSALSLIYNMEDNVSLIYNIEDNVSLIYNMVDNVSLIYNIEDNVSLIYNMEDSVILFRLKSDSLKGTVVKQTCDSRDTWKSLEAIPFTADYRTEQNHNQPATWYKG